MNRKVTPRYYDVLKLLQKHKHSMSAAEIGMELEISDVTVWTYFHSLHKEELVTRILGRKKDYSHRTAYLIRMTEAGKAWKDPEDCKPQADPNAPRHPCGCPIVASTPGFCMRHHNEDRWSEFKSGTRYFLWTMKQAKVSSHA